MPFHVIITMTAKLRNLKIKGKKISNKKEEYPGQDQVFYGMSPLR